MLSDFRAFSPPHLLGLIIPVLTGIALIIVALKANEKDRHKINVLFACLLIIVRGSRYVMDIFVGRFELYDLFSLQICHIDLILLIICLLRPNKYLYHFVFLIGIPMGLAVALMPGSVHPEPGLPRAVLFIMSHTMLVVGAVYLSVVESMKLRFKYVLVLAGVGNVFVAVAFVVNKILTTNFLYIMYAPEGSVIAQLDVLFGWPGYVAVMDLLAVSLIISMYLIHRTASRLLGGRNPVGG